MIAQIRRELKDKPPEWLAEHVARAGILRCLQIEELPKYDASGRSGYEASAIYTGGRKEQELYFIGGTAQAAYNGLLRDSLISHLAENGRKTLLELVK